MLYKAEQNSKIGKNGLKTVKKLLSFTFTRDLQTIRKYVVFSLYIGYRLLIVGFINTEH